MRLPNIISALLMLLLLFPFTGSSQNDGTRSFSDPMSPPNETETEERQKKEESFSEMEEEPDTSWLVPVSDFQDTVAGSTNSRNETDTAPSEAEEIPAPVEKSAVTTPVEEKPVPAEEVSFADKETESDSPRKKSSEDNLLRFGLGLNIGARFHFPEEINTFVTDIWNYTVYNTTDKKVVEKNISPGLLLKGKGMINLIPYLGIEPFAQGMWAGKLFSFEGGMNKDVYINSFTLTGGINLWLRLLPEKMVSIRIGGGGYAAYTILKVTGDIGTMKMFGYGYGGNGACGVDVRLNKIVINLDLLMPFGFSGLGHQRGNLGIYPVMQDYPLEYRHLGVEICPGITFYF